jgi:hypothetical protein
MRKLLLLAGLLASAASAQISTLSNPATVTSLTQLPTIGNNTLLGNNSGGSATPSALTAAQSKTLLSIANTDVSGLGTASTAATGTSGHTIPYLDGNSTFSGANIFAPFTFNHGDGSAFDLGSIKQVYFGFNATVSYRQAIGTRHSSSTKTGNTFDFWLFDGSTQAAGDEPNVRIMTLDASTGLTVIGNAAATNLSGTNTGDQFTSIAQNTVLGRTAVGSGVASALSTIPTATMPALTGDVTTSAGAVATTIPAGTVTLAKQANFAASSLQGNPTGSSAAPSAITLAGGLGFSGTTLTAAGALTPTSVASTGAITSSGATSGVGYATGAGGAVTQITSRTTGVTNNKACGAITMFSAAGSATWATFTVTDSAVAATDTIIANEKSGTNLYMLAITSIGSGTFNLSFATTGGTATDAPVINYCVIKGVAA